MQIKQYIIDPLKERIENTIGFFQFAAETLTELFAFRKNTNIGFIVLVRQILFTGFEALGIISLVSLSITGLIIIQGNSIIPGFSQSSLFNTIFVSGITRELSCLLTAFIIVARSGTAISTELGNMSVNLEIESLVAMRISPVSYLVVPRLVGVTVSMIILTIYFNFVAILGGYFFSIIITHASFFDYLLSILRNFTVADFASTLLKSTLFGIIISVSASYQGLRVSYASTEVPQRTIKAVVQSLGLIIIVDIAVTILTYLG
ncbi:MAG: ABC transporter permease [Ignavibacteriaceae bacterium]|nr:ABC transporter permease [Ignavibacteriaceae bacterium]